jgi:hypothetical protein
MSTVCNGFAFRPLHRHVCYQRRFWDFSFYHHAQKRYEALAVGTVGSFWGIQWLNVKITTSSCSSLANRLFPSTRISHFLIKCMYRYLSGLSRVIPTDLLDHFYHAISHYSAVACYIIIALYLSFPHCEPSCYILLGSQLIWKFHINIKVPSDT